VPVAVAAITAFVMSRPYSASLVTKRHAALRATLCAVLGVSVSTDVAAVGLAVYGPPSGSLIAFNPRAQALYAYHVTLKARWRVLMRKVDGIAFGAQFPVTLQRLEAASKLDAATPRGERLQSAIEAVRSDYWAGYTLDVGRLREAVRLALALVQCEFSV
jgi:hypothetical protein